MSLTSDGSLNVVAKAMRLKRSSGSALRSTFMRRIGALPGAEQELGELFRREVRFDLAHRLAFGDAGGEARNASAKISASRARSICFADRPRVESPIGQPLNSSPARWWVTMST